MKILILRNKINYSISVDVEKLRKWLTDLGLTPVIEYKDVALPLSFKSFGIFRNQELFGLDKTKQKLRDEALVPLFKYDVVMFCFDDPGIQKNVANWTYPNDINTSAYCEIVYRPEFVGLNGDVLIHEMAHAFQRLLYFRGINIIDTLDNGAGIDSTVAIYKPLFKQMLSSYSIMYRISKLKEEIAYFKALLAQKKTVEIEQMILRIAKEEGVDGKVLLATIKAESGLNPNAVCKNTNGSIDKGLCQYNNQVYPSIMYDIIVKDNEMGVKIMAKRMKAGFLSDWYGYRDGNYKKFL